MSRSATEQPSTRHVHVKPLVDYSAVDIAAQERQQTRQPQRIVGEVIGVPIGLIREGSAVMCSDGKAGHVARVVAHPQQGYPMHIIVRRGQLWTHKLRVSCNWVASIAPDHVELNLRKDDLAQQPDYRPDDAIAEAVEALFHGAEACRDHSDYLALQASVEDGIVTLRGNVRSAARRLEAEQLVNRLRGVVAVHNVLFADDEIEWKTAWVLQRHPRLRVRDLRVETCLGLVRLHGQIASASQRALAATIARQIPGVHAVNNGLTVETALEPGIPAAPAHPLPQVKELVVR